MPAERAPAADAADLYSALARINERPPLYSRYTADALWTSPDISEMLLRFHLDGAVDVASRRTEFVEASIDWLDRTFALAGGRRVVDLGCGPGLYTNPLARRGARVTGIDFSERSIEHARAEAKAEGLDVDHVLGDYLAWQPAERFDVALMIMCDFCALDPGRRRTLLDRVGALLEPGGAFVFDVYSSAAFETWEESASCGPGLMDGFWSAEPYFGFMNTFRYPDEQVVLEKYVIVEQARMSEYFNWFQHYDPERLTAEIEAAGLRVESVLGDVAGEPYDATAPEFAMVVRRP